MHFTRRALGLGAINLIALQSLGRSAWAQTSFDTEFANLLNNEPLLARAQEFGRDKRDIPAARGTVKSREKSLRPISKRAIDLIVALEVTGKSTYERKYQGVIKPGGASGITIGIGYDVGYVTPQYLKEDWQGFISDSEIAALSAACNVTGDAANRYKRPLSAISIPWDVANNQFLANVLPVYVAATLSFLPNAAELSND